MDIESKGEPGGVVVARRGVLPWVFRAIAAAMIAHLGATWADRADKNVWLVAASVLNATALIALSFRYSSDRVKKPAVVTALVAALLAFLCGQYARL